MQNKLNFFGNLKEALLLMGATAKRISPFMIPYILLPLAIESIRKLLDAKSLNILLGVIIILGLIIGLFLLGSYIVGLATQAASNKYTNSEPSYKPIDYLLLAGSFAFYSIFMVAGLLVYLVPTVYGAKAFEVDVVYAGLLALPLLIPMLLILRNGFLLNPFIVINDNKILEAWKNSKKSVSNCPISSIVHILGLLILSIVFKLGTSVLFTLITHGNSVEVIQVLQHIADLCVNFLDLWLWATYAVVVYYKLNDIQAQKQAIPIS